MIFRCRWINNTAPSEDESKNATKLNINDERIARLALQVATENGRVPHRRNRPCPGVRLEEVQRQKRRLGLSDRLMELGKRTVSHAPADWLTRDLDAELYGERGSTAAPDKETG
jgi:hypothetical protein